MRTLLRRGRARISVPSVLEYDNQSVGKFAGNFVAIGATPQPCSNSESNQKIIETPLTGLLCNFFDSDAERRGTRKNIDREP